MTFKLFLFALISDAIKTSLNTSKSLKDPSVLLQMETSEQIEAQEVSQSLKRCFCPLHLSWRFGSGVFRSDALPQQEGFLMQEVEVKTHICTFDSLFGSLLITEKLSARGEKWSEEGLELLMFLVH